MSGKAVRLSLSKSVFLSVNDLRFGKKQKKTEQPVSAGSLAAEFPEYFGQPRNMVMVNMVVFSGQNLFCLKLILCFAQKYYYPCLI